MGSEGACTSSIPCAGWYCGCVRAGDDTVSVRGAYVYMEDLHKVRALRPPPTHTQPIVPPALAVVFTPLIASAWEAELQSHPDREFANFVVDGIRRGFRIGFDYS